MEINKEQFDAVKKLSEIQISLSEGLAALKTLKETTEEYMVFREKEAEQRVAKVLKESRDALENISTNYDQLTRFREELKAYAHQIKSGSDIVVTLFKNFRKSMDEADEDMKVHYASIKEVEKQIKIENSLIKTQREELKKDRLKLEDETRLLTDRRDTLDRGFEELKRLKAKKHG